MKKIISPIKRRKKIFYCIETQYGPFFTRKLSVSRLIEYIKTCGKITIWRGKGNPL